MNQWITPETCLKLQIPSWKKWKFSYYEETQSYQFFINNEYLLTDRMKKKILIGNNTATPPLQQCQPISLKIH